jgi:hypothetical protein
MRVTAQLPVKDTKHPVWLAAEAARRSDRLVVSGQGRILAE